MPGTPFPTPDDAEGLPLYAQVASTLRTAIERGIYAAGSRIPTEGELCHRFQCSRHTIRDALRQLRNDGLITSRPGSRPVVVAPDPAAALPLDATIAEDFFDYMLGTRLVIAAMEMTHLPPALAAHANLPTGEPWLSVQGWRTDADDGHATCWNEYLIRPEYADVGKLLARHVGPFLPLLEDLFGERVTRLVRSTRAIPMPAAQAERFGVAAGSPALAVLTRCENDAGRIVLFHHSIHANGVVTYAIRR